MMDIKVRAIVISYITILATKRDAPRETRSANFNSVLSNAALSKRGRLACWLQRQTSLLPKGSSLP